MTQHDQQDAPHFTREWLLSALSHVRGDFEAALSGEAADDERARSRMQTARALGLDALAPDVLSAIDDAVASISALQWPGGLEVRYLALVGALREIAEVSTATMPRRRAAAGEDRWPVAHHSRPAGGRGGLRGGAVPRPIGRGGLLASVRPPFESLRANGPA